jgi:hypothetical protein
VLFDGQLRKLLQDGIDKGRWTLQDLDSPGRHTVECCQAAHYRNPLRDNPEPVQPVQPVQPDPGYDPAAEFPF